MIFHILPSDIILMIENCVENRWKIIFMLKAVRALEVFRNSIEKLAARL